MYRWQPQESKIVLFLLAGLLQISVFKKFCFEDSVNLNHTHFFDPLPKDIFPMFCEISPSDL